jgi:hypothetical protein
VRHSFSRRRIAPQVGGLLALAPCAAQAHGFAQRYDLPVPLGLYIGASAAAVALSFVVVAFFVRGDRLIRRYPRLNLLAHPAVRVLAAALASLLGLLSVAALVLVIVGGLVGPADPFRNIAPTAIWVVWWVGLAYVSGLAGNLWALVNPWSVAFSWVERSWRRLFPAVRFGLSLRWPAWLGRAPAIVLFACFVWAELIWPQSDVPASLARAALAYSIVTWLGMFLFGRHTWLSRGEAFSVAFGFLARFAPSEIRVTDSTLCAACATGGCGDRYAACVNCPACFAKASWRSREFNLRPWAVGLLGDRAVSASSTIFVLLMLSSVTFDGLLATPLWAEVAERMLHSQGFRPLVIALQDVTGDAVAAVGTLALVLFLAGFQLLYLLFSALMRWCVPAADRAGLSLGQVAGLFVLSLVPIALAYHLAHYLSYLAIVGQYMIPLLSDPFGLGWNLLGTRLYVVDIGVVNARMVWYTSVIAIVAGHIVAVWLAHVTALRAFASNRAALRSQVPMLLLMVGYTMLSLWILAQPVVETG